MEGNKCAKILPIYDILNTNIWQFGVFHELLSVDESMVPYFGRHGAKCTSKENQSDSVTKPGAFAQLMAIRTW